IAGWPRWCRDGAGGSGSWLFHRRRGQNLPLDGFKFGGVSPGVRLRATKLLDLLIHAFDAVLRIGMVGEKLRGILPLRLRFELLEKLRHGPRVVARIAENLSAHHVGLRFRRSRVPQKHSAARETTRRFH